MNSRQGFELHCFSPETLKMLCNPIAIVLSKESACAGTSSGVFSETKVKTEYSVGFEGKMAKGIMAFPKNALEHARVVKRGWEELGDRFLAPNLTREEFARRLEHAEELVSKAEQLRRLRAEAVRKRDEALSEIWIITKKVRNAAKAIFGDDSPEVQKLMLEPTRQWKRVTQKREEDE